MRTTIRILALFLAGGESCRRGDGGRRATKPAAPAVKPPNEARLAWWREARFGMFIHWGPVSLKGTEIGWSRGAPDPDRGVRQPLQAVQPGEVRRRRVGEDRQGRRHEVHGLHHQAPRRLLHVRHQADRLQHHEHAVRPRRGQGTGRGLPEAGHRLRHLLLGLRLAPPRLPARQPGRRARASPIPTWTATSSTCAGRSRS